MKYGGEGIKEREREREVALPCCVYNYFAEFQFYIFLPMFTPMLSRSILVEFNSKEKRYSRGPSEITYL